MITFDELPIPPEFIPWILPASILLIGLSLSSLVIYLGSLWLVYAKAGRSGWLIFVPFVNAYVMLRIAGQPGWHFLLLFIPIVNFFVLIFMWFSIGKAFGKGALFNLGLIFFNWIFLIILAFGRSEYQLPTMRKSHVDEFQPINVRPT